MKNIINRPSKEFIKVPEVIENTYWPYNVYDKKGRSIGYTGRLFNFKYAGRNLLWADIELIKQREHSEKTKKHIKGISGKVSIFPRPLFKLNVDYQESKIPSKNEFIWELRSDVFNNYIVASHGKFEINEIIRHLMDHCYAHYRSPKFNEGIRKAREIDEGLIKRIFEPIGKEVLKTFPTE